MSFRIVYSHDQEHEAHAKKLVARQVKKLEEENPKVNIGIARVQRTCDTCDNSFWIPGNSSRWECTECRPTSDSKKLGF